MYSKYDQYGTVGKCSEEWQRTERSVGGLGSVYMHLHFRNACCWALIGMTTTGGCAKARRWEGERDSEEHAYSAISSLKPAMKNADEERYHHSRVFKCTARMPPESFPQPLTTSLYKLSSAMSSSRQSTNRGGYRDRWIELVSVEARRFSVLFAPTLLGLEI